MEERSCGGVMGITETDFSEPKLKEMHQIIDDQKSIELRAILMKQNPEKEGIWFVRDLRITPSLEREIRQNALNYIEKHAKIGIKDFDVENDQSDDYLIEKLPEYEVPVVSRILSEMRRENNSDISYNDLARSSYLKGFAITFSSTLTIFNKVTRNTLLKPKKYLYMIPSSTGEFSGIEEQNLLSIPTDVDTILYEDSLFIFNRNHFIQLFKYEKPFEHYIMNAEPSLSKIIDDPKKLIDGIKNDTRKIRRLASACAVNVEKIAERGIKLEPIAKEYGFKISFSDDKINIEQSETDDVLKLLNAQAVKDAIFQDKYIAHEKVKV
jgi:hypothetical protein